MDWCIETNLKEEGFKIICGVDEAGRGPLAGPVVAAAVILPYGIDIQGLNDSKKLTAKKRGSLYEVITSIAQAYAIGLATNDEIDKINILQATFLAMNRAIELLPVKPDIAIIDGNQNFGIKQLSKTVAQGDAKSPSIAAASILAKVTRDRFMTEMAEKYPYYAFEKHKGYGTKLHYEQIRKYGISEIHRKSFLKKIQ